ncbi:MAG: cell division protein ZapE, partial [Burkholderiales bacterium]
VGYYTNKLMKERYAVDAESLRVFFPYQAALEGMLNTYQRIFGLTFTNIEAPYVWAEGVQLFVAADAPAETLYTQGSFANEFARTVSRLTEMQTRDYLAAAHLAA